MSRNLLGGANKTANDIPGTKGQPACIQTNSHAVSLKTPANLKDDGRGGPACVKDISREFRVFMRETD